MIRLDARKPVSALSAPPEDDGTTDFGTLAQLGLWGGAAAACLLLVAIATRTETGQARLSTAYAALTGHSETEARRSAERERESDEARRTAETIHDLTQDRDRLLTRMTALERNYEDVTGSIKLNAARPPAEPAAAPLVPVPAPAVSAPASAPPPVAATPAPATASAPAAASVAVAPAAPEPQDSVSGKAEFGVDVGGGPTVATMRTAWDRIRRNHATLLEGLRPLIAVRDGRGGQVELRLVVGPIGNAAGAAKICAALAASGLSCQPTMFEGQRLALR